MNDIKDLLAEVLHDPAPPMASSADVLTLARRAERRRRGWWAAGGAGLAVTTVVLAASIGSPGGRPTAPQPGTGSVAAEVPPPPLIAAALRYRPTWLPPGLGEQERYVSLEPERGDADDVVIRRWRKNANARIDLSHHRARGPVDPQAYGGTRVDINGSTGFYYSRDKSYVTWLVGADTVLTVTEFNLGLSKEDLLRVARSIRPDPATMEAPFRLGHVPAGVTPQYLEFRGTSPAAWHVEVGETAQGPQQSPPQSPGLKRTGQPYTSLSVALGTETAAPNGGEPLTIGGRPARFITGEMGFSFVVVDRGQGLLLTMTGAGLSRAELVATAEGVQVGGRPDTSWIGAG